ncbi:MAG: nickel pincer cofactor biosynthesis protein LarB [Nitrososphaerales archaeon]
MKVSSAHEILRAVKEGKMSVLRAERILKLDALGIVDEIARLDMNRHFRREVPEIVYARGKTNAQLVSITSKLVQNLERNGNEFPIILSKITKEQALLLESKFAKIPKLIFEYFQDANIVSLSTGAKKKTSKGKVALLSAGTSDIKVLNESEVLLRLLNCKTLRFNDVGIASLKRLSQPLKQIQKFDPDAIIVAAGMEGALPSLIAGLSSVPVIGLPTSVGYGYGGNGEAALMSMLQACPLGICVVNIDGGIAAGIIAWLIAKR